MRGDLKTPLGELIRGDVSDNVVVLREILEEKKPPCFATVGDYVTFYVIESGLHPDLAVVDHRVMRQTVEPFKFKRSKVTVSNPAGTIKAEAQRVLRDAITLKKRLGVVVEGEEDLLVLPLMAMMPIGSVIVYGQPREGMVVVTLTEERRRWAKDFMAEMEEN
ncbi:GTP-dependent dephospho-CoA kinase family protein [Candidatus Bathyarchaeota archaeon]|nr:GTP-dependent dephospho-CoA kinase family protein [Candidatus Bathyarchaeota archaeon]